MRARSTWLAAAFVLGCSSNEILYVNGSASDGSTGSADGDVARDDAENPIDDAGNPIRDAGRDAPAGSVDPPLGGSSGGSGGAAPVNGTTVTAGGITYRLIVPSTYAPSTPTPLLVVYSGTEGGQQMTQNLQSLGPSTGSAGFIRAVLDGVQYNGNGNAGATVLDDVRAKYNVDNDRTYLLGESAGTTAALKLGFRIRQSYFAAYWANDVNATDTPAKNASELGFAPHGQAGPGGDFADATAIVNAMKAAGYRVPNPAPYNGAGAGTHGSPQQFTAALSWFAGKSRQ
jgi:poly(3-hydroxybutyrate) depolymerase